MDLYVCDRNHDVSGPFPSYTRAREFIAECSASRYEEERRTFRNARVLTADEFEIEYGAGTNPLRVYHED